MSIVALVLAAGKSSRMGSDKLSMRLDAVHDDRVAVAAASSPAKAAIVDNIAAEPVRSEQNETDHYTVGGRVVSVLLQVKQLSSIIIVQSPQSSVAWQQQCQRWQQLYSERVQLVHCEHAALGMSHSLRCGVRHARSRATQAIMIVLADQPLLEPAQFEQLATHWLRQRELDYVAAASMEGAAPPLIFAASVWDQLEQLAGDQGARRLLTDTRWQGAYVPLPAHCFWDADTPLALQRIRKYWAEYVQ
ncbi:nucleotidyltransferase family protein [Paenibacillus campi]|uniref:nucleotidyltransferase family protein n=1 Tax=Paenibacillus campi TaxID=3106031 RepID=UPI002AFE80F5|nr:nucleotidyltransferase family protein [Paenibacillus sp. SGZ-1014]